ncbi:CueP family metal-binding protein [Aestuariimicrobium ganziense]|uniref:CueP family metal-binding protein n=1 Tax=Aestuariimicrobium ganziense TaxID=2773677 RepID=UPI00194468BE|nr:CueP family metal-binding protein [Aestuariimicrobium ganziense]
MPSRRTLLLTSLLVPVVAACSGQDDASSPDDLLTKHGLGGKSGREVVETLEASDAKRPTGLSASVRVTEVQLAEGELTQSLPLPGDLFYLSLAPYASRTHDCFFHNLGTCQGELTDAAVHVTLTDASGKTLVDEETRTHANGFVGFWLPRGIEGTLKVTADGRTGSQPITTHDDAPTCVTTLQVA